MISATGARKLSKKASKMEMVESKIKEAAKKGEAPAAPAAGFAPEPPPEEAVSGPDPAAGGPAPFRSEAEDAMLLYMDDSDEESDD